MALEKLSGVLLKLEADLRAQLVVVVKTLYAKRARVELFERDVAVEAGKRQLLLAKYLEMLETESRQLAKSEESLRELQSKVTNMTAKLREWRELATEHARKLKVAKPDIVSQTGLWETVSKSMNAQNAELAELQEQLAVANEEVCKCQQNTACLTKN